MPNVTFLLKEPKAKGKTIIYLFFRYYKKCFKYSTSQHIDVKYWNAEKQRARENRSFAEFPEFNAYLDKLETETQNYFRKCFTGGFIPETEDIRKHLDRFVTFRTQLEPKEKKLTFFEFFQIAINEKSVRLKPNTLKAQNSTLTNLKIYAADRRINLDFENITNEFFYDFMAFMYAPPRSFSVNYASKIIEVLKQNLSDATERGHNMNLAFQSKKFSIPKEKVHGVYLTELEIQKIFNLDLSEKPIGYATVRDLFLVGCYTGLRFSDWSKVRRDQVKFNKNGAPIITVTTEKTKQTVSIPLHPIVEKILNKYAEKLPTSLQNQKTNKYLKEIAELAEINTIEILPSSKGGKRVDVEAPKFAFIGTHTARRSFATNAHLFGMETLDIMSITGHTTEREFLKYIKLSKEEKTSKAAQSDFFKNK